MLRRKSAGNLLNDTMVTEYDEIITAELENLSLPYFATKERTMIRKRDTAKVEYSFLRVPTRIRAAGRGAE